MEYIRIATSDITSVHVSSPQRPEGQNTFLQADDFLTRLSLPLSRTKSNKRINVVHRVQRIAEHQNLGYLRTVVVIEFR